MKKDALGNEVVMGQTYGYSRNSNGFTTSTVGEAIRETKSGVTLKVLRHTRALYDDDPDEVECSATVNAKAAGMFPIDPKLLMTKKQKTIWYSGLAEEDYPEQGIKFWLKDAGDTGKSIKETEGLFRGHRIDYDGDNTFAVYPNAGETYNDIKKLITKKLDKVATYKGPVDSDSWKKD